MRLQMKLRPCKQIYNIDRNVSFVYTRSLSWDLNESCLKYQSTQSIIIHQDVNK